jgi:hypothetical protein
MKMIQFSRLPQVIKQTKGHLLHPVYTAPSRINSPVVSATPRQVPQRRAKPPPEPPPGLDWKFRESLKDPTCPRRSTLAIFSGNSEVEDTILWTILTLPYIMPTSIPTMTTRAQNRLDSLAAAKAKKAQESQAVDMELLRQMEVQQAKRLQEKKKRDEERKKEEEIQRKAADEQRRADEEAMDKAIRATAKATATSKVVSPAEIFLKEQEAGRENINKLLQLGGLNYDKEEEEVMEVDSADGGEGEDVDQRSPVKKKGRRKANFAEKMENDVMTQLEKPRKDGDIKNKEVENPLKPSIRKAPPHIHTHSHTIIEACIQIIGDNPERKFVEALKELLRNVQIVDKYFSFSPIKAEGAGLISDSSKIPVNMTVLGAHFKISSQGGGNPFERQKVWGKNKKAEGEEFKDPIVYFTMAVASDEDPAEIMDRIRQEWGRMGGKMLKVKDLQSFDSETIISLFNICTQIPKKLILEEFKSILYAA